uniref:Uncharacterized protein n=1 Tax=Sphaerodactylus townsendi TaxID=933632 RepID=A0ACB8FEC2_9SAUR
MDFAQFGQWMAEHQAKLTRDMAHLQQETQVSLMKEVMMRQDAQNAALQDLTKKLGSLGGGAPGVGAGRLPWVPLTKLTPEDDIDSFVEAFERTAEAAGQPARADDGVPAPSDDQAAIRASWIGDPAFVQAQTEDPSLAATRDL